MSLRTVYTLFHSMWTWCFKSCWKFINYERHEYFSAVIKADCCIALLLWIGRSFHSIACRCTSAGSFWNFRCSILSFTPRHCYVCIFLVLKNYYKIKHTLFLYQNEWTFVAISSLFGRASIQGRMVRQFRWHGAYICIDLLAALFNGGS